MNFLQDLRIACRSLLRTPAFTALSTGVLGLGLAVVVTMFGLMYAVGYESPPLPEADSLVAVHTINRTRGDSSDSMSTHDLADLRASQTSFEDLVGSYSGTVTVRADGPAERYDGGFVTGEYFQVLRMRPLLGRTIEPRDAVPGAAPVTVLGEEYWQQRFAGDRAIIGRALKVNGEMATIIGVMPKRYDDFPVGSTLWVPIREDLVRLARDAGSDVNVIGRLKQGISIDQAQTDVSAIYARLAERYPETNAGIEPDVLPIAANLMGREDMALFTALFASVFLVLIIACVNVSGLMLVRATARMQEASVRRAMGAGRIRLAVQMLTEALVIGLLAALVGLTLGAAALEALDSILLHTLENLPRWWDLSVDGRVAAFAVTAGVLSTLLAGLYPALRASGVDINSMLRDGTRHTGRAAGRIIRALVVVEIALSCVLLTSAGIMVRAALNASNGDLGVDVRPFMTGRIGLPEAAYPPERQRRFIEDLYSRAQAIPGSTAATLVTAFPGRGADKQLYALPDRSYASRADYSQAASVSASPGFFATMRGRILDGRDFTLLDRDGSLPVALVNEEFARSVWPGRSALGQQLRLNPTLPDSPWLTVVGITSNIKHDDEPFASREPQPTVYVALLQQPERFFSLVLRTERDPHSLAGAIRDTVTSLDPDLAVYFLRTIPEHRAITSGGMRILGGMFVIFGIATILLAASGIYGVLAHSVAQGTRDIAIRRALGAPDGGIVGAIARRSGWQLALGLIIGIALAPAMTYVLGKAVGGTSLHDAFVYTTVIVTLTVAIGAATVVPLRRALRLQPGMALRYA